MVVYIDGDGSNVISLVERFSKNHSLECHIFCDINHAVYPKYAKLHIVEQGSNSADFAIVNCMKAGDIVVTNDSGLASLVLARKGIPVHSNGTVFTEKNILYFLNSRHLRSSIKKKTKRNQVKGLLTDENKEYKKPHLYETLCYIVKQNAEKKE